MCVKLVAKQNMRTTAISSPPCNATIIERGGGGGAEGKWSDFV